MKQVELFANGKKLIGWLRPTRHSPIIGINLLIVP